jgi:hypothetical protein
VPYLLSALASETVATIESTGLYSGAVPLKKVPGLAKVKTKMVIIVAP